LVLSTIVEPFDFYRDTLDFSNAAGRESDPVGPHPSALREDSNLRPVQPVARVPGTGLSRLICMDMKIKDHFDMGEFLDAEKRIGFESRAVKLDARAVIAPAVFGGFLAPASDMADRHERYLARHPVNLPKEHGIIDARPVRPATMLRRGFFLCSVAFKRKVPLGERG
jgi:hypothetical protein